MGLGAFLICSWPRSAAGPSSRIGLAAASRDSNTSAASIARRVTTSRFAVSLVTSAGVRGGCSPQRGFKGTWTQVGTW